jgi:Raf kinase inhibitor-like YbhB/YbcL family protein
MKFGARSFPRMHPLRMHAFRTTPAAIAGAALLLASWLAGCTSDYKMIINKPGSGALWGLTVTSPAWNNGQEIPSKYAAEGQDISPPLAWTPGPEGVVSFAIAVEDPDAGDHPTAHWMIWNIPAGQLSIPEGVSGFPQGANYKGAIGYTGPTEHGDNPHNYFFEVYALSSMLSLPSGCSRDDFAHAIDGKVLSKGQLQATH